MFGVDPRQVVEVAVRAEHLGFDGVWLGDHVVAPLEFGSEHPYDTPQRPLPVIRPDVPLHDIWVTLSVIAGATSDLRLTTAVLVLPMRPPLLTAQAAATLQRLSGGRFTLGVGSGWLAEEYEALGADFASRGARMDEMLEILGRAMEGGPFDFEGRWYSFRSLQICSERVEVPLVFGGSSPRALARAARHGDGWYNPSAFGLERCAEIREAIERRRAAQGTDDRPFTYHLKLPLPCDRTTVARYRRQGFDELVVPMGDVWQRQSPALEDKLRDIEALARELLP